MRGDIDMTDKQQPKTKLLILSLGTLLLAVGGFFFVNSQGALAQTDMLIRVGLSTNSSQQSFSTDGGYQLIDTTSGKIIANLNTGDSIQVTPEGSSEIYILNNAGTTVLQPTEGLYVQGQAGDPLNIGLKNAFMTAEDGVPRLSSGITVNANGQMKGTYAGPLQARKIDPATNNLFTVNNKQYRGNLEFTLNNQNTLTVVNELPLEKYLYGVVPAEMPSSWPLEALKAQAVAARNYVLLQKQSGRFASSGFDVTATDLSQVYGGYTAEKERTNTAVDATQGVIMLAQGKPINAVYHSSSGGYTENSEDVWNYPTSYLKAKVDTLDMNSLHYNWQYPASGIMTIDEVRAKLLSVKGWNFATISNIVVEKMASSGNRIQILRVEGTDQTGNPKSEKLFNADVIRSTFGLKSGPREIWLNIGPEQKPTGVVFRGSGWGHGIGMSQWGARGMAQAGSDFRSILQYYYTDITLVENYGE